MEGFGRRSLLLIWRYYYHCIHREREREIWKTAVRIAGNLPRVEAATCQIAVWSFTSTPLWFIVIFQGPKQMVAWGGQIRTVGWMGGQFPAVLCSSVLVNQRGTQQERTFRYPKISIISWTAWCPTPSCAAISLTVILRSCLMIVDFLLVALSCSSSWPTTARLIGDVLVSVLKMFHPPSDTADTMQTSPYTPRSRWQMTPAGFPSVTRNSVTVRWRKDMSVTAIFSQFMTGT
jgi:hypothetical protein